MWYYLPQMEDFEALHRMFTSRIRTKLLQFFLTMPKSSFYIRELERKTGEDAKNVSRELTNLEEIGFLRSEKRGNQKFYTVREDFLFYPELKALFLKSSGPTGHFREMLLNIEGLEAAFLKEVTPADVEGSRSVKLLIIGRPDLSILNDSINSLMNTTGFDINYRCYSQEEFEERRRMEDLYILEVTSGKRII
jgi:predicted transcriptional regulator with HTH domain